MAKGYKAMRIKFPGCNRRIIEWVRSPECVDSKCTFRSCRQIARQTPTGVFCLECYTRLPSCGHCGKAVALEFGERLKSKAICPECAGKNNIPLELLREQAIGARCSNLAGAIGPTKDLEGISDDSFMEELDLALDRSNISPKAKRMLISKAWSCYGVPPGRRR